MTGYGLRVERALSSKPRAIQQHFETTALSPSAALPGAAKIAETGVAGTNLPRRKRQPRIRTIQFNSNRRHLRQWRTSNLACPRSRQTSPARIGTGGCRFGRGSRSTGMELTTTSWKNDRVVRLLSGGEALRVIGTDKVGSVICRPLGSGGDIDIHVPPSLLVAADPEPDAGASGHSTPSAAENA